MQSSTYILFGSQTGNAEEISKDLFHKFNENGIDVFHSSLNNVTENDSFSFLQKNHLVRAFIICSTTGNGDAPESANRFWRTLKNRKHSNTLCSNLEYAVLGLGDTNYDKFCQMGKNIDKRLFELGGKRILDLHCADEATCMEEQVDLFLKNIYELYNIY